MEKKNLKQLRKLTKPKFEFSTKNWYTPSKAGWEKKERKHQVLILEIQEGLSL